LLTIETAVSTASKNVMPNVHNRCGKVCNVWRQNSCDMFYNVM